MTVTIVPRSHPFLEGGPVHKHNILLREISHLQNACTFQSQDYFPLFLSVSLCIRTIQFLAICNHICRSSPKSLQANQTPMAVNISSRLQINKKKIYSIFSLVNEKREVSCTGMHTPTPIYIEPKDIRSGGVCAGQWPLLSVLFWVGLSGAAPCWGASSR